MPQLSRVQSVNPFLIRAGTSVVAALSLTLLLELGEYLILFITLAGFEGWCFFTPFLFASARWVMASRDY